jgi:hypothetical protein
MGAAEPFDPAAYVERVDWTFAKTMRSMPHEYVVEGKNDDPDGFAAMVAYVAEHGFLARWGRFQKNRYLEMDGWRYWALPGRGVDPPMILNRERLPGQPLTRL